MENIKTFFKKKSKYFPIGFLKGKSISFFFPISLILTIIPLIVHIDGVRVDDDAAAIYGKVVQTDLFSQRKAHYLLIFSIILVSISVIFFKEIFRKRNKILTSILVVSAIFLIFTLLSAIFSKHKNYAFYGAFDRAEGFVTITCYIILFIYSIYAFKTANDYKYVLIPILILVAITSFLGIFQYIGKDLINSNLGLFIVLGKTTSKLNLAYETGKLYGTLYHYNYVGSFVAIVLPILFSLTIFEKKIIYKIVLGIASLLSVWLLFGSTSRAGIIGIAFSTIFGILIFGRSILKKWKPLLIVIISIILIALGLNFATKGIIFERIPVLVSDISSTFNDTSDFDFREHTPVKDIKHIDGHAEVMLPNEILKIYYENNNFVFKNSKDEIINYIENNQIFTTDTETFKDISFQYDKVKSDTKVGYIYLRIKDTPNFMFRLGKDYTLHLVSPNSKDDIDIVFPETFELLNGKEKLGSMRGYIWSRSIPLIKNNLILGSGPDTFIYQFPKYDLIGKYYAYDTPNIIIDKPHNLYLQIALNDGLIALLAFLVIMLIYIADSIKLYALKSNYNNSQILGASTCLGVIAYLFAGIFNDSVVSVSPIFWAILGVGVALNYINKNSNLQLTMTDKKCL